jgi:hypothetical protein
VTGRQALSQAAGGFRCRGDDPHGRQAPPPKYADDRQGVGVRPVHSYRGRPRAAGCSTTRTDTPTPSGGTPGRTDNSRPHQAAKRRAASPERSRRQQGTHGSRSNGRLGAAPRTGRNCQGSGEVRQGGADR